MDFSIPRCKRRSFRFHEIFNTIDVNVRKNFQVLQMRRNFYHTLDFYSQLQFSRFFLFSLFTLFPKKKKLFHLEKEPKRKGGKRIVCETQEASRIRLLSITARFYRGMRSLCRLSPCNVLHRHLFGQHPLAPCLPSSPVCFSPLRATVILLN